LIKNESEAGHSVKELCQLCEVSESGYYAWLKRGKSKTERAREQLGEQIEQIHKMSRGTYGIPRITAELRNRGMRVNRKRVARVMRERGLKGLQIAAYRPRTTDSRHNMRVSPNLLAERKAVGVGEVLVGDITYIATEEGWEYLAAFMDAKSRLIKGWSIRSKADAELVQRAFQSAASRYGIGPGTLVHTDRGSQYASEAFRSLLARHNAISSMCGKGYCYDNAAMESFWATLKRELRLKKRPFKTREEARATIFEYIEAFYNRVRLHTSLAGLSPWQYEQRARNANAA